MSEQENGTDDVTSILIAASVAASADGIDEKFRTAAFEKAVDVILATRMGANRADSAGAGPFHVESAVTSGSERAAPTGGMLDAIAGRLKVARETVAEVFDDADGKIDVIAPTSKIDSRKAPATKEIAVLVAAARQGAGLEEWTDADEIRQVADGYRRYDSANFASTLKEMEDVFRVKQTGRKITVRLGRPGWDRAAALVKKLGGEAE